MPKRTVTFAYYTEKDGTVHPFGSTPDLSDEEAKRGDELGAFEESDNEPVVGALTPGEGNLNVQTPATHVGKEGLTGTRTVVPELENSEPDKDEDLEQDPADKPGDETPEDEVTPDGEVLTPSQKKAAKKSSSKSGAKPRAAENAPVGGKG
jgi:hypothetical protein